MKTLTVEIVAETTAEAETLLRVIGRECSPILGDERTWSFSGCSGILRITDLPEAPAAPKVSTCKWAKGMESMYPGNRYPDICPVCGNPVEVVE